MADEAEALMGIRANAERVVAQLGPSSGLEPFGFDAPSVEWLDGFIERQRVREEATPEFVRGMVNTLGSYLGESIIRSYGGHWSRGADGWRVEFDAKNAAYPFAKVEKQFANGSGDSVYAFFAAIPAVFRSPLAAGSPKPQAPPPAGSSGWSKFRGWFERNIGH